MNFGSVADWAAAIAAIGAAIAAFLSVYAAHEMNRRTKAANRTAAFAERYIVFELAREALEMVVHNKPDKFLAYQKMQEAKRRAWFLFPSELVDSLERMRLELIDATTTEDIEGGYSAETAETRRQAVKSVTKHLASLNAKFAPHMRVDD